MEAQGSGRQLTTLYQASGLAVNQQGFLKVKLIGEGEIAFGSAVSGAPIDVELVKTVVSQPYNISILQVTKPIVAPGIDPQSPPVEVAKAPVPTKGGKADAPSSEEVTAPSPSEVVTDSPAEAPAADAPAADASSPSLAPGPDGGEAEDAADAETPSSSLRTVVGLVGAVMCFASLLVVM
ncbi:hypothetical protein P8452_00699 [Trifolium repens]|nr:hypothetical protein P8452_00699 [Trifolium repens]